MNLEFGQTGTILKAAGTLTSNYSIINAISDATITLETNWIGAGATETIALAQGQTIYGDFKNIVWVSGTIVAYR